GVSLAGLLGQDSEGALITIWSVTYLGALFALLVVLIRSQERQRRWAFWPLAAALVVAVMLSAHDLAWWMGWIDYQSFQLAHFHVPLVLVAIAANIIDRPFQAVAAVERATEGLAPERKRIMAHM